MHQSIFRLNQNFNNDAFSLDFCAENSPLIFIILNAF